MTTSGNATDHHGGTTNSQSGVGRPAGLTKLFGEGGLGWAMIFVSAFLLFVVVVDTARGRGLETSTLALATLLLPQGVRQVAASRGMPRLTDRAQTASRVALPVTAVLIWAGLINDWAAGRGTNWLLLVGGVLLLVASIFAGAGAVAQRRSARAGTSERMNA